MVLGAGGRPGLIWEFRSLVGEKKISPLGEKSVSVDSHQRKDLILYQMKDCQLVFNFKSRATIVSINIRKEEEEKETVNTSYNSEQLRQKQRNAFKAPSVLSPLSPITSDSWACTVHLCMRLSSLSLLP